MAASTYFAQVQQLYIAYFGRPADTTGLNFWATQIDNANGNIAAVQAGFSASAESTALFGNSSNIDKVTAIYQNAFGRQPEAAGLTFWVNQLNNGTVSQAQAAWTIQQSAGSVDAAVVQAKLVAAQAFTAQIDTTAEIQGYQGTAAADAGRAFLATVTSSATGVTAVANAANALAGAVAVGGTVGTTFALTTGVDTLTGTAGNDIFNGANIATNPTLSVGDTINGGAGNDTFNLFTSVAGVQPGSTTNVEVINVNNSSGGVASVTAGQFVGATNINSTGAASVTVTGLSATQQVGLSGSTAGTAAALFTATQTTAGALTLNLNGAVGSAGAARTVDVSGATALTVTSTGTASTLQGVTLGNAATTLAVNATANAFLGGVAGTGLTTVTASGTAASVNLGTLGSTVVTSINASGLTAGGLNVTLANGNVGTVTFVGGAGNDTFNLGNNVLTGTAGQINAGAGTGDTLGLTLATQLTTALAPAYVGFEILNLGGVSQTYNIAPLTGITGVTVGGATGETTVVNGLTALTPQTITSTGVHGLTVGVTNATTVGTNDTLNLVLSSGATLNAVSTLEALSVAGVETLNITAATGTGATTVSALTNGNNLSTINLLGDSPISFTVGNNAVGANLSLNATGAGNHTIDFSGALGSGVSITSGAGNDILIGSGQNDVIRGGAGNDVLATAAVTVTAGSATATAPATITGISAALTTGVDILTGGTGNDSFAISHSTVANASSITDLNLGTNVVAGGVDGLWFNTATPPATAVTVVALTAAQQTAVTAAATLAAAVDLVLGTASGVNNVAQFTYGTDTYIVTNGDGATTATYTAAQDNLVKITGVVGVLDASDIHFVAA
ncbi:DUF4214 domain-containing protein [Pseudomonas sp. CDFA 602]|uniref:beta strand repeat-containing protein n=1 Tax=Pseudomonas californiensis TaxID=2829823 RepID=UPI001E32E5C9|nr:DUF4214 domain-containing protein [Pseudomonas californiensis]MCD5995588.1 DUF4214 domain-containing protein [Pseudomonas californiensis]MCD6001182.1 DUF4214 domain-containing protein [Pseudomonas californiensis]